MKTRTMRTLIAAVLVGGLTAGASGCGSTGPSKESSSNSSEATYWALTGGNNQIIKNSVKSWNSGHPDQKIDVSSFANDAYKTKVHTAIGAGNGPTLIYGWGGGVLKSYVKAGEVKDLTGFLKKNPKVKDRYLPSVLKTGEVNGKIYALPHTNSQPVMFFFNKKLFKKIGEKPPQTWQDLLDLIPKFKDAGITPIALAGQSKWPDLMWLEYLVDRIGGPETFKAIANNKPDAWSDPAITRSLKMIQQLVDAGGFSDGFSSVAADNNADQALLYTGKAAMLLQGGWIYQSIKTDAPKFLKNNDLGYTSFPKVKNGKGNPKDIAGNPSNFLSVSAKATKHQKQTALHYLKKAVYNDDYVSDLIDSGAVPAVKGVKDKLKDSEDSDFLLTAYNMTKDASYFQLSWDQALSPKQGQTMLTKLDEIFLKKIKPKQFANAMNKTIKK